MGSDGLTAEELQPFFARSNHTDEYETILGIPHEHPPADALALVTELAEAAPDDSGLCWVGVSVLEPLIELHWRALGNSLDRALKASTPLRKALSCVWLSGVPRRDEERWRGYVATDENVSHQRPDEGA